MTQFAVGVDTFPYNYKKYPQLTAAELRLGLTEPVKARTLRRWRKEAPQAMSLAWVASQHFTHTPESIQTGQSLVLQEGEDRQKFGHFQDSAENRRLWKEIREQADALSAQAVVLETPAALTPSQEHKKRLEAFATGWGELDAMSAQVVWSPSGFWEREEALEISKRLGWLLALDPLFDPDEPLPEGNAVYFRMSGRFGVHSKYTPDDFERLLDVGEGFEQVTVIFSTREALKDAREFARTVQRGF